ncbi:molecular chaperone [Pseudomonas sp. UM16]|uniref:molecular chaperone n=1 Tax=Pseudomonas sp. UM16 TaxID=3158962 RepID=UPI00398FCF58
MPTMHTFFVSISWLLVCLLLVPASAAASSVLGGRAQVQGLPREFEEHLFDVPLAVRVDLDGRYLGDAMVVLSRDERVQLLEFTETQESQRGVVASPARLIVPAQGTQAVRVLYRGTRDRERYFRLRFIPVLPESGDGFAVDAQDAERYREQLKAGVNLLAGYGSLLFVRPGEARFQTPVRRQDGQLTVINEGHTTVVLDHFPQCSTPNQTCEPATKHHLLPGRSRQFDGESDKVHQFELHEGENLQLMVLKG